MQLVRLTASLSRLLHLGSGSTIGGRVGLLVDPLLLEKLTATRRVVLVSGTNGKTTTTRLAASAAARLGGVATSEAGANMAAGLVSALVASDGAPIAVLEVDEAHLPRIATAVTPEVIVLLNLSRDQLDRTNEVRMLAQRWRESLPSIDCRIIANADDPLVVWAASTSWHPVWVGAGGTWHEDAYHCPACDARIEFDLSFEAGSWSCSCGFSRPETEFQLSGDELIAPDQAHLPILIRLPGRFNRSNAAMAAVAALELGVPLAEGLGAMSTIEEIAGRFSPHAVAGRSGTLMLAKNPAGWTELINLVTPGDAPVVIGINSKIADGHDPSWLWDVPFERLSGHAVLATGKRRHDLALRLLHAGVAHLNVEDPIVALREFGEGRIDFIGNYTAFQEVRRAVAEPGAVHHGALAPLQDARAVVGPVSLPPTGQWRARESRLRIVVVHPDLLGTYGDAGNALILANRALWRDVPVELVLAPSDVPLPRDGDVYCLGGGEDGPQERSANRLGDGALNDAVERGASVLAICAGYQILGHVFPGTRGTPTPGLSLLDVSTVRGARRSVGEVTSDDGRGHVLTGFENHAGRTIRGAGTEAFARVRIGVGNGDGTDGARAGRILATYLHGPVLARNAWLGDLLLSQATGNELEALDDEEELRLAEERLRSVGQGFGPLREFRKRLLKRGVRGLVSR